MTCADSIRNTGTLLSTNRECDNVEGSEAYLTLATHHSPYPCNDKLLVPSDKSQWCWGHQSTDCKLSHNQLDIWIHALRPHCKTSHLQTSYNPILGIFPHSHRMVTFSESLLNSLGHHCGLRSCDRTLRWAVSNKDLTVTTENNTLIFTTSIHLLHSSMSYATVSLSHSLGNLLPSLKPSSWGPRERLEVTKTKIVTAQTLLVARIELCREVWGVMVVVALLSRVHW